ncbi:MAG: protein kinase [Alistipes sp.]|nr:protein kinase [Alistipes sp.]
MFISIRSLLACADSSSALWGHLHDLSFVRGEDGRPIFRTGNSAVIFKVTYRNQTWKMKCYVRPKRNLRAIYRENFFPKELCIPDIMGRRVDVVLEPWVEGETLNKAIATAVATGDRTRLAELASSFDALALRLLQGEWAHGDLKPENIIVNEQGIHLIDFDAIYRPGFEPEDCNEIGTLNFQHPARGRRFDKSIDDYPIALISTALHALAVEPSLYDRYPTDDALLIELRSAVEGCDKALSEIKQIFTERGMTTHYRIAQLLHSAEAPLSGVRGLLKRVCRK